MVSSPRFAPKLIPVTTKSIDSFIKPHNAKWTQSVGVASIAISLASWQCNHFETAGEIAKRLVKKINKSELSYNTIINVNVPDVPLSEIKGIKSTRLGSRHKSEPSIKDTIDPSLYLIGENGKEADNSEGTDFHAISNNFVSVTPLQIDTTKHSEVKRVSEWLQKMDYWFQLSLSPTVLLNTSPSDSLSLQK